MTALDIYPQFEESRETENLKEIVSNRLAQEQRKLFHDNAMRFYQLAWIIIGFGQDVRPKGRVPEWSNGVLSKSIERAIVPGVRIPPLPPDPLTHSKQASCDIKHVFINSFSESYSEY